MMIENALQIVALVVFTILSVLFVVVAVPLTVLITIGIVQCIKDASKDEEDECR